MVTYSFKQFSTSTKKFKAVKKITAFIKKFKMRWVTL